MLQGAPTKVAREQGCLKICNRQASRGGTVVGGQSGLQRHTAVCSGQIVSNSNNSQNSNGSHSCHVGHNRNNGNGSNNSENSNTVQP